MQYVHSSNNNNINDYNKEKKCGRSMKDHPGLHRCCQSNGCRLRADPHPTQDNDKWVQTETRGPLGVPIRFEKQPMK